MILPPVLFDKFLEIGAIEKRGEKFFTKTGMEVVQDSFKYVPESDITNITAEYKD